MLLTSSAIIQYAAVQIRPSFRNPWFYIAVVDARSTRGYFDEVISTLRGRDVFWMLSGCPVRASMVVELRQLTGY